MSTDTPNQKILQGDCLDAFDDLEENSFHAVVTDPPYGLAFMSRGWDQFEPKEYQEWCEQWASAALRVLKPGGHLIAFSGNRTHHRLFSAVEDAGFEIRDTLTYHYGTGFPKGSDVGKHIDRYYDAEDEREVVGKKASREGRTTSISSTKYTAQYDDESDTDTIGNYITEPATSEAEQWDGWRSQLKPSTEFAVLARAPMSESAVYRNVLEHGCGALNIDRTRIPHANSDDLAESQAKNPGRDADETLDSNIYFERSGQQSVSTDGRYPANLLLDGVASRMLDEQSGECGGSWGESTQGSGRSLYGDFADDDREGTVELDNVYESEPGGASRFFYTAKASKSERTIDGQIENEHPTVKPLDLMEWLVTLVTAPGQRVLDPFAGSGTTIMACHRLGREGIGIEMDDEHAALARKRVELAHELETERVPATEAEPDTDGPATLESFGDDDD